MDPRGKTSKQIGLWSIGLLLVIGLVLVIALWPRGRQRNSEEHRTDPHVERIVEPPADPNAKSETVIAELLGFVNDPSHAARGRRVYEQAGALDDLVNYYDRRGNSLPRKVVNPSVTAVAFKDREILLVAFTDEHGKCWSAPFEWAGDCYRLHWEAMTGFGAISWRAFFEDKPKGTFRMRAKFYLPEDAAPDPVAVDQVAVLMSHPELEHAVTVLVPKDSEVYQHLASYPRATDIPATVEIRWQESGAGQPVLTRWLHRDWML